MNIRWPVASGLYWDPQAWSLRVWARRFWRWVGATRRRRWTFWILLLLTILVVIPMTVGAIALAQTTTITTTATPSNGISFTNVRDSTGMPVSDYWYLADDGSVLHPLKAMMAAGLNLEFAGFIIIAALGVYWSNYAASLEWLTWFSTPITDIGNALTRTIATSTALAVGATIGAGFVAWFVVRGFHAKAAIQVATMVVIALFGATFLADPMADLFSPDGMFAEGRDIGVAVAEGINGDSGADTGSATSKWETDLATYLIRDRVQDWDFGHVEDQIGCGSAWNAGILSNSETTMLNDLNNCGDSAGASYAESSSGGQLATGLMLIMFSLVILLFSAYLGLKIVFTGIGTAVNLIKAIFLFALLGFVYGPLQTALFRAVIGTFTDGFAMMAYFIYYGVWISILDDLFGEMPDGGFKVMFLTTCFLLAGLHYLRSLSRGIKTVSDQIATRMATAAAGRIEDDGVPLSGTGGAGMGGGGIENHMKALTPFSNANVLNGALLAQVLRKRYPLDPYSRRRQRMELRQMEMYLDKDGVYSRGGPSDQSYAAQKFYRERAEISHRRFGGDNLRSVFDAMSRISDGGGSPANIYAALGAAGFDKGNADSDRYHHAIQAHIYRKLFGPTIWDGDPRIGEALASLRYAERPNIEQDIARANVVEGAARLAYAFPEDLGLAARREAGMPNGLDDREQRYVDQYLRSPNRKMLRGMVALYGRADPDDEGDDGLPPELVGMSQGSGQRMLAFLQNHLASQYLAAAERGDLQGASRHLERLAWANHYSGSAKMTPSGVVPHFS